jgi:hypothetical protein
MSEVAGDPESPIALCDANVLYSADLQAVGG